MANFNRITLVGRLTGDPDTRTTLDSTPLTRFTLAVDRPPRGDGTREADFIPVVTWRNLAEISGKFLKKGGLVLIDGRIQIRTYNDQLGQKHWVTEVVARNMKMLDRGNNMEASPQEPPVDVPSETTFNEVNMPDIPFEETEDVQ